MGHVFSHSAWLPGLYFAIFLLGSSLLIIIQMKKCHLGKIKEVFNSSGEEVSLENRIQRGCVRLECADAI